MFADVETNKARSRLARLFPWAIPIGEKALAQRQRDAEELAHQMASSQEAIHRSRDLLARINATRNSAVEPRKPKLAG
jgi:predicted transglutaminase-like cysteine proteinase